MKRFHNTRRLTAAGIGAAALLVVAGGIVYATIPDASGVIHGCYSKSGGDLRVIDNSVTNCKSTETALNWNLQGPQGVQGPQGAQGPQGPAGTSGTSHGFFGTAENVFIAQTPAISKIVSISGLKAGTYMLWGQVWLDDVLNEPFVDCEVLLNGSVLKNTVVHTILKSGSGDPVMVSGATLSGTSNTIEVDCRAQDNTTVAHEANLTMIQIDTLN